MGLKFLTIFKQELL